MDHFSANNIIDLYQQHSAHWDRIRSDQCYEESWLNRFLALLPAGADILDIGCGSGKPIANYFMKQGFSVTGVDASTSMIALCRQRFPAQKWHVADMRALSLNQRFDGLVAWDSFFHLTRDDQRKMFPLFGAHASDKAVLMFTSGSGNGEAIGEFQGEPLYHASLAPEEYRTLLADHGFSVIKMIAEDPQCTGHTIWLAQKGV
ncbi:class I SAM-dependent DNA methyltransferase [Ewingella sp. S1.OA.A_B6]